MTVGTLCVKAADAALAVAVSVAADVAGMAVARHYTVPCSASDVVQQADANLYVQKVSMLFPEVVQGMTP